MWGFFFLLHQKRKPLLPHAIDLKNMYCEGKILHDSHGILICRHTFFLLCIITCFIHFHWVLGYAVVDFSRNGSEFIDEVFSLQCFFWLYPL